MRVMKVLAFPTPKAVASAPRASPAHALRGMRGADGATSRCRARYCASLLRLLRACVERGRLPRVGPARLEVTPGFG